MKRAFSTAMEAMTTTIGTHSGVFQADEALGVWMLKQLPPYRDATVTRSRDVKVLAPLKIVIDVAGSYDHEKLRYDHHQRGFFETFDGTNPHFRDGGNPEATGPETATGDYKTKLSASGLVYKHYGRELIVQLYENLASDEAALLWVYNKMYKDFMEGLDANDNGIEIADEVRYKEGSSLPVRVSRMNPRWNAAPGGPTEDERFFEASALCGREFSDALDYIVNCELPARKVVEEALLARSSVHESGEVICLKTSCPWKQHLYELERAHSVPVLVKFALFQDNSGMWRMQAVTAEGTAFTNRLGLLEPWRGLRDAELVSACGVEGAKFVHAAGFIGGNETYEGALAMAVKTLENSQ